MTTLPFKPVFFMTDILFYILMLILILVFVWGCRHESWRIVWCEVIKRKRAMCALVVLLTFVFIALLDSVHFRMALVKTHPQDKQYYSTDVVSLLDALFGTRYYDQEESYSKPFALKAISKKTVFDNGQQSRIYPNLKYVKDENITSLSFKGASIGFVLWLMVFIVILFRLSKKNNVPLIALFRNIISGGTKTAWREILITLLVLLLMVSIFAMLMPNYHILGTDKVGYDVLYKAVKSIRTGLIIGTLTTLFMVPFAVAFGMSAGFFGGVVDDIIQYIYTTLSSIPAVLLISAAVLSLQIYFSLHPDIFPTLDDRADARLLALCIILGITSWTSLCRLLRAETLKIKEMSYIEAAKALGTSKMKILLKHVLPNVMHIVLITIVLDFSALVLAEAVLSYVGVGVDPTMISWGNMINSARLELAREPVVWWPLLAAFVFMFTLVLSANLFADAVRDALDPRLRNAD